MGSDTFIREVDEEIQRDRLNLLWRRYGLLVIGLAVVVVVLTAGWVGWSAWQDRERQNLGAAFARADTLLREGQETEAADTYRMIAADASGGAEAVAALLASAALARAEAGEGVEASLAEVSRHEDDLLLRDGAEVLLALRSLDGSTNEERIAPLLGPDRSFHHLAQEIKALALLEAGEREQALDLLRELRDDAATPVALRARAVELLASLGVTGAGS